MKKENKSSKSKYTIFTLIVCVIAVLSGKPISEVLSDVSSTQETTAYEESYDYEEASAPEQTDDTTDPNTQADNANVEKEPEITSDGSEEEITFNEPEEEIAFNDESEISDHSFRSQKLLDDHYKKHGLEMGFDSPEEYVENANRVISSPDVLYKLEEEDNDHVYYLEETNEFVVVSQDGYIRTYFNPSAGIDYFNRQ